MQLFMQQLCMIIWRVSPQLFDWGLIGEIMLHAVAAAAAKVAAKDAILVPAAATVYAQPLQLRRASDVITGHLYSLLLRKHPWSCRRSLGQRQ